MTRMWLGVDPAELCDQHLLGEHAELHQEVGSLEAANRNSVRGHVREGQVDLSRLADRHDKLVEEMRARGMNHDSPLDMPTGPYAENDAIDEALNRRDLADRCDDCRSRMDSLSEQSDDSLA